jgi:hypothetical protein
LSHVVKRAIHLSVDIRIEEIFFAAASVQTPSYTSLERLVQRLLRLNAGQLRRHLRGLTHERATWLTKIFRNFFERDIASQSARFSAASASILWRFPVTLLLCARFFSNDAIDGETHVDTTA